MADICNYIDFRTFLRDSYKDLKAQNRKLSYETLARKLGLKSKGLLHNVLNGRRNITQNTIVKFCRLLELTPRQADYFEALVHFNQCRSSRERTILFDRVCALRLRLRNGKSVHSVLADQYDYFRHWYYPAVRAYIDLHGFDGNATRLARALVPRITTKQAKQAIGLLQRLNLIAKDKNNTWQVTSQVITTPPQMQSLTVHNFHRQMGRLAVEAVDLAPDMRNFSAMTLGISANSYARILQEIKELRQFIRNLAEEDARADTIYQLNFQLFPLSEKPKSVKETS